MEGVKNSPSRLRFIINITFIMAWVLITTLSAASAAAARREGRVVGDRAYGTKKQADAARTSGAGRKVVKVARPAASVSQTPGWVSSVVTLEWHMQLTATSHYTAYTVFGAAGAAVNFPELYNAPDVKLQGLRAEVKIGFAATKLRWACGLATSVSAGDKQPADILRLGGSVGSHDPATIDQWFTVGVKDLAVLKKTGQTVAPTLMLLVAAENVAVSGSTQFIRITFHATILKPSASTVLHSI